MSVVEMTIPDAVAALLEIVERARREHAAKRKESTCTSANAPLPSTERGGA